MTLAIDLCSAASSRKCGTMSPPSLYDHITVSLQQSELTYAVSLIRELARKGQLDGKSNELALQLPMNAAHLKRVIDANPKLKDVMEGQNEDAALQFAAVSNLKERNRLRASVMDLREVMGDREDIEAAEERLDDTVEKEAEVRRRGSVAMQGSHLLVFHDQADKGYREQTEMVYGLGVDDVTKRVTVVFRGSRTPSDWAQNKKFFGVEIANPVKKFKEFSSDKSVPDKVFVHEGFHEYLHREDGTPKGIFEALLPILESKPGYFLNITGHSLGGGLASLFAVEAASRDDIPKPVFCVTHAQPLVGDARLSHSVAKLAENKLLYLLRTRNSEDGVPAVPAFSPKPNFAYTHLGTELKMYDDDRPETIKLTKSQPRFRNKLLNTKAMVVLFVIKTGQDKQKRAHTLGEHFRRIKMYKEEITGLGKDLEAVCS